VSCKKEDNTPTPPTPPPPPTIAIGESYQGGKIAYILQAGDIGYDANVQHGLIAAPSVQGIVAWGCNGLLISGADGTAIGTGAQNTLDIMYGCNAPSTAARYCWDLVLGGYSDWYLPSKNELNQLYINKDLIGGFENAVYWSSTEFGDSAAWWQVFGGGTQVTQDKDSQYNVRAVRSF
jgi:hypothetical protein